MIGIYDVAPRVGGAWIETSYFRAIQIPTGCRPPRGGRGLKHVAFTEIPTGVRSPPAWGAWIETDEALQGLTAELSPPAWGAWIETFRQWP